MTFRMSTDHRLGVPDLQLYAVDTSPKVPIGTIVRAYDDAAVQGDGEFIYLPGVAAVVAGDAVVYDLLPSLPATVRAVGATHANSGRPVAIALTPVVAGQYGWFQVGGVAIVNTVGGTAAGKVMLNAAAGSLSSTALAGAQVMGALMSSATAVPAAGKSYVTLNRPCVQGQIT